MRAIFDAVQWHAKLVVRARVRDLAGECMELEGADAPRAARPSWARERTARALLVHQIEPRHRPEGAALGPVEPPVARRPRAIEVEVEELRRRQLDGHAHLPWKDTGTGVGRAEKGGEGRRRAGYEDGHARAVRPASSMPMPMPVHMHAPAHRPSSFERHRPPSSDMPRRRRANASTVASAAAASAAAAAAAAAAALLTVVATVAAAAVAAAALAAGLEECPQRARVAQHAEPPPSRLAKLLAVRRHWRLPPPVDKQRPPRLPRRRQLLGGVGVGVGGGRRRLLAGCAVGAPWREVARHAVLQVATGLG